MAVKKRTLGDDLRDFKAGKAPDGYRNNIKNTTPYAIKSWQYSDGFVGGEDASYNPIFGDNKPEITEMQVNYETKHRYENDGKKIAAIVPKAQKNYDVPTREQYLSYLNGVRNTATVPSRDQMTQYKAESDLVLDMDMGGKYGNATYEQLKKGYKTATDGREKEWLLNRIKESASSKELEDWKKDLEDTYNSDIESIKNDGTKDKGVQYSQRKKTFDDDTSEIESLIEEKRRQETAQKNQKKNELYEDYYKNYDYEQLKKESENGRLSDYERTWLRNKANEKATSQQLQNELDKLASDYDSRLQENPDPKVEQEYEKKASAYEELIDKKKYEEKKKVEYDDVIENDIKAKTIMQKYYYLQKYDELNRMFESTGHGIESVKVKSSIDAYNYANDLTPEERKQIIKDFNSLENKDTLYKYYKREREEQETAEQNQILNDYSEEHPVLGSLASMGLNTYGSVEDTVKYAGAGIDKAFGGDGYVNPDSTNVAKAQLIREKVSEDMDGLGKFFYNTGMSIGDNIARMPLLALPGGEAMSLALAGTSAGVSSANDVINSGGSLESALWTGAAAGTAEVVFEKIPLDNLIKLKNEGTDSVFRAVVNQMKTEGLEEVGTDIANAITDQIINGDMSQLALQYQNYIAQGYSEEEARKQIAFDFASQLGQSFAAGAISGGVLSGGTVAINKIGGTIEEKSEKRKSASQLGREALQSEDFNVNELIKTAKKSDNPKAVNLANSLEKVVEEKGADNVKAVDVGNLLTLTNSDEITYDYSQDLSELTGTDKQNIIDRNFELNGEEKTDKTSDSEVKYTDTKAFGENYPHGLGAKISKTGERITIVGLKSSSKDFNSDDNTVIMLADNGELYDSDDIRTTVPHFNDLFDYAKNFDTIGARVYLSQYEDYAKRSKSRGKTADIAEYSECFERLYSYGAKGVTYDSIKKSGNFTREINILSAGVAYSAVQSGNNDFKVDTRDKSNKSQKIRMPGESNSINSKVYVDPGSEDSVKVTDEQLAVLQAVADKSGREIVLTDRMGERTGDENANGGYNLNDGKIYINAEVHDSYMLSVSLHEAVHGVAADNPAEYHALCTFITNYLVAKGENIDNLLDDIKINWKDRAATDEAALEELVCQTVMAIATDEAAIKTALSLEENKGILKKVASALKKIAKAAYDFIKGVGIQAHNKQAQPWINDIEALNELATRLEKAFESTRKFNEQRASAAENTETEQKNNTHEGMKFSYGGPKSKTANISLLDQAIQMENSGKDSEAIRQKTGWFRGMDGMWRFELDDSKIRFYKATKQDIKNIEEYKNNKIRYNGLSHKIENNTATAEQQQKFKASEKYIKEYETSKKLSDYVSHPELFRAYPQLKEVNFYFDTTSAKGAYYPDSNAIVINPTLSQAEQRESVIHEIQHAIQQIEGFADGSTMAQWQKNGADSLTAYNNYINTAGEIEARDTANRVNLNAEQRKNTRPDIDRKDVVFAESGVSYSTKYSFKDQIEIAKTIGSEKEEHNHIYVSETSEILQKVGLKPLPILYSKSHLRNAIKEEDSNYPERHGLRDKDILKMPEIIESPAIIMDSKTRNDSIILVSENVDKNHRPLIMAIKANGKGTYNSEIVPSNFITSYYGRNSFISFLKDAINEDKVLFINKKKSQSLCKRIGVQFPNGFYKLGFDKIIHQSNNIVNNNSMQSNKNNTKHSVNDVIDENRDLVAVHNLSAKKLAKMISDFDGKGIPAPSIAIDKADNVHSDFGEISLIFDRNTIDPKADRRNSVYSRDAWTSMYPQTEFKLNEKAMKKLAERLDMSVNELKTNMFDTSDIQKIKYRFEDDIKVRQAFLKENNIKVTPVLRDRQPDIMMFSARAVKKFVRKNDCTFDRLVNDKGFRNQLFKAYSDGASLKGIAKAHIEETDEILDLAKSEEFYSALREKFDYAIEYARGNVQQTEGSMTEAVNNAIEEYEEEFDRYIDDLLSSGVLGEEYIVRDDVDPYDENGNRKPFSKTHYKYNIENVVKAMKSGRSKVGSSFTVGVAYVKSIGAKKMGSIDEIKGNKNKIVPMTDEELEAENERISDLIKPLIEEVADSGSYNNDFITASNDIVDAFNGKKDVNGVYNYLKQYHNKIKMNTVKKLFAAKAEIENLPTRYFEAKPHRAVSFDEVKAAVIPADTHEALKGALKELGVPMYEYDSNNENSRAEVTQKAINTEYVDNNGEKRSDLRFSKDDTIVDYSDLTALDDEEIKVYNKRGWTYQLFTNEDRKLLDGEFAKLSPVETQRTDNLLGDGSRMVEINNKVVLIGGSFDEPEIYCVFAINADNETEADIYKELLFNEKQKYDRNRYRYTDCLQSIAHNIGETFVRAYIASDFRYYKGHKDYGERAVLPSNFKNYGYTEQFQDGEGDNPKAGRDISEIKLAVDDTITDGMFADGDLFDEDGYIQQSVFERAVKDNPDFALTAVYNHAAKTAETAIKQSRDVKLTNEVYMKIAHRLMSRYDISRELNKDFDEELAQIIKKHTWRMEKGVADFAGELELLVDECKDALMLSGKLDGKAFKTEREEILGYLRGKTLILSEYAESDVRGDYDTLQNYRKRMFGKINVAYEKNLKNNSKGLLMESGNNIYIDDVITFVEEHFPYLITDDADDISGYRWLDNLVNNVLKPKFVNKYVDGFYENIDTAAIEMAFDVTTEVIYEKAKLAVSVPNAEHKVIKEITALNKKAEAEQKALLKAKAESYRNEAKEERRKRIKMIENLRRRMAENTDKSDKQRLKYEAQIEHLKSSLDKTTVILNMGYETIRDQYNSNRERTANINSINKLLAKLEKRYLAPKPKEYIPADIYNPLHDVLTTLIELDGRSKKVGMLAEKMRTLIEKLDAEIVNSKSVLHIPSAFQDALLGYTDEETGKHVDGSLDTVVKIFANSKAKSLKGFSNEEIKQIKDALSQVEAILHSANEIVLAEKRYNAYVLSREIEKEIEPVTGTHSKSEVGRALKTGLEMFQNEMNDAKRFARRMVGYKKDSLFVKMFDELNRGQTEAQNLQMEWTNKAMQAYSEFSAKELDDYKHKKALTIRGIDFTADMLVEMALEYQDEYAREHMMFAGYHVPNINYLNKKNKNVAYSKDRSFFFVPTKSDITTIRDYVKSNKFCNTIFHLCYNLYNEDMQSAVNKISLQKYGYKLAKVRNYCPITIDTDTVEKGFADVLINRSINSRAFLHMRDNQRHNRLKLVGALDKLGRQIDSVSSWCGLTIPIENFTKVYNMERFDNSFADVDGKRKTFVKDALPGVPLLESVEAENNSENKEIIKVTLNNADKISNKLVFDVSEDVTKNYNKKSEGISEYFNKLGNKAINPDLGVIELNKSGAKSTLFHGFGEDKLVAVTAIKDVIEQGKVIDHTTNYKNKNYDRYIISGLGKINGSNCYVSVVIKSYPNNKNMNSKFYLHEVTKIETNTHIMTGTQLSENPVSEFASKEIVPQSGDDFKQNLQNNKPKENNMIYFRSVKENLKLRWGNWADDYISKLMGKLQGATKAEASKLDVLTSNYTRGVLTGNINSAIVQISSYPLAASVVGWKPVAAGLKHIRPGKHTPGLNRVLSDNYKHSVPYDELAKYTPILWHRQQGHNNRDINEINKYKSLGDKSGILDKLNWIEKMDTIMVDMNYWICYEYVKNELKISPESKEFMPKVAETLEEIINSMMPNSSIMQQGQILRRDNPLLKVFTICKSQVFCMANAIMDSTGEYIARRQALKSAEQSKNEKLIKEAKADLKESKTKYIRTFSSVTMSVVMTVFLLNVIKAFVTGKYDKYKDEDGNITASSVGLRMLKDFGSEFTGMFLFGDIIYNFALSCIDEDEKFWGVSYPGIEIINDLFTGINKLINSDERNFLDNLRNIIGTAGLAKGLPIKNMDGLIQGIYNHFVNSAFYDFTPAVNNNGEVTTKKFANTCYNALVDGNKQLYNTYHSQWLKQKKSNGEPVDEKYINSKLKDELEDDKEIIAAADAFREGNLDKYEKIVKKFVGFGFKEETVTSAVDSIINETEKSEQSGQADNEAETEEEEDKATLYTYSDAFEYLKNGDRENYERVEQYLIDNTDKTKKDVQSAMRSASRTDKLWKAYFEAQGTLSGGGDPVKLEEYKKILTNIYGSWSTAVTYGRKYQKRMKEKEKQNNK